MKEITIYFIVVFISISSFTAPYRAQDKDQQTGNRPERLEWFRNQGLGMFIHWSYDSQLGVIISHSMAGSSESYLERYINELPETFNPEEFNPDKWARLAKVVGMEYVVFTAKHHSGFCMWDTETTEFNVMNTPFNKDILKEVLEAFRKQDIDVGLYFSPTDFWFNYKQGYDVSRYRPKALPKNNPELMKHNNKQVRELLTNYGKISTFFFDLEDAGLNQLVWELQPNCVITRYVMETPERFLPEEQKIEPWEACYTMGSAWAYKPTHEEYKDGTDIIEILIETRAKGGNLLLNIGPKPNGEIPFEQERLLRELALWRYINHEAIYNVKPWHVIREDNIWFTQSKDQNAVYAIITEDPWHYGERNKVTLKSVVATDSTKVRLLGQTGRVLSYYPDVNPEAKWTQDEEGLHINAMLAKRIYSGDELWPNPVVIKITDPEVTEKGEK